MFERQMGVASVGVMLTPGAADRWPYEKVISKRDMLTSVLSYVSIDGCAI